MTLEAPRRSVLIVFPPLDPGPGFPWRHVAPGLGAPMELVVAENWAHDPQASLQHLADETAEVGHLTCAGLGAGASAALAFGRVLGAHAIIGLAPGAAGPPRNDGLDPDSLAARFADDALTVSGQTVSLLTTPDSIDGDLALAGRLQAVSTAVSVLHTQTPFAILPLAARLGGWGAGWIEAIVHGRLQPGADLTQTWRDAFRHEIEIDLEATQLDHDGGLKLSGRLWNRSERPFEFDDEVFAAMAIEADILVADTVDAASITRCPLPCTHLPPGQAAPIHLTMDGSALARPAATLRVGLACHGVKLQSLGFPATRLGLDDTETQAGSPVQPRGASPKGAAPAGAVKRADVIACYRAFLGREPESEAAIEEHLAQATDLWALIRHILQSRESMRWRLHEAALHLEHERRAPLPVEVEVSAELQQRLIDQVEEEWRDHGQAQPFFSALANPDYLSERLTSAKREEFYGTGAHEVSLLEAACRLHGVDSAHMGDVLEFGCRVGRAAEPLARACGPYTGVDISPRQLEIARDRLQARGVANARFTTIGEMLVETRRYGLLFSVLTLQHYPPPVAYRWLDQALARVRPAGFAFFQLPCHLYDYSFAAKAHLRGGPRRALALHALPQQHVFALLAARNFIPLEVTPAPRIGGGGLSYSFFAQRQALAPQDDDHLGHPEIAPA